MVEQVSVLDLFRLDGQVSVVTGGSEWLGFDVASALAEAGSAVVITSRTQARAAAAAAELGARYGVDTLAVTADQCRPAEVAAAAARIHAWKGRIDVLVNNAGGGSGRGEGALLERDPDAAAELIATNLTGVLHWCQEAARHMLPAGRGRIINIASVAAMVGRDRAMYHRNRMPEQPVDYAAAKGGVIGLTLDLAGSLSPRGIRVNAISPAASTRGTCRSGSWPTTAPPPCSGGWGASAPISRARRCFWPRPLPTTSPATTWWWTAASRCGSRSLTGRRFRKWRRPAARPRP